VKDGQVLGGESVRRLTCTDYPFDVDPSFVRADSGSRLYDCLDRDVNKCGVCKHKCLALPPLVKTASTGFFVWLLGSVPSSHHPIQPFRMSEPLLLFSPVIQHRLHT